jgi:hypothetical protein
MVESSLTVLHEPVLLNPETENVVFQAGALANEGAAEEVLTVWRAEGRSEPMAVNFVPLYRSVQE